MDFAAHAMAIEAELSAEELEHGRRAAQQMDPETLVAWRDRLMSASAKEAAELVRAQIQKGDGS